MASKVGDDVTFRCVGKGGLEWNKHIGGVNTWLKISTRNTVGNVSKYALNTKPEGTYDLTIKSVLLSDARRYQCITMFVEGDYGDAELIVFGKTFFQFYLSHTHLCTCCTSFSV